MMALSALETRFSGEILASVLASVKEGVSVCWLVAVVFVCLSGRHSVVRKTTFGFNFDKEHQQMIFSPSNYAI